MIAAVFAADARAAERRLATLGEATPRVVSCARGALAVSSDPPRADIDPALGRAWIGDVAGQGAAIELTASGLTLSRGPFGGRSLYYACEPGLVVVCSRLAPLLASKALDVDGVAGLVALRPPEDRSRTAFSSIRRVAAGEAVVWDDPNDPPRRSSSFRTGPQLDGADADELARDLRGRFVEAVARAMKGAGRVGVLASGGVDSSAVLAAAVRISRERGGPGVVALNHEIEGDGDDRPYFRQLCAWLGVEVIRIAPLDAAAKSGIDELVVDARPLSSPTATWDIALARKARAHGVDVILSGAGGDDLFDGDLGLFDPWSAGLAAPRRAWAAARLHGVHWAGGARDRLEHLVLRPALRKLVPQRLRVAMARSDRHRWAGPALTRHLRSPDPDRAALRARSTSDRMRAIALSGYLLDQRDGRSGYEIASRCEARDPFFDPALTSFVATLPAESFFSGGWVRGLFRDAIAGLVPDAIRFRESKGRFELAFEQHLNAIGGPAALEPILAMRGLADLGIVEPKAYRERFERLVREPWRASLWTELWPALAVEVFVQRYG